MKGYLANGLFGQADRMFNDYLANILRNKINGLELYVPQENMGINDKKAYASSLMIAGGDDSKLLKSDFVVAIIDGVEIDSGVACEIGKFVGYHIAIQEHASAVAMEHVIPPIFALFTDSRQLGRDNEKKIEALVSEAVENQFPYRNLYVIGTIKQSDGTIVPDVNSLVDAIKEYYKA